MKKFTFPLDRVLQWRRTQASVDEMKLARLHTDLRGLQDRRRFLDTEAAHAVEAVVRSAGPVLGRDLAALDRYRKSASAQAVRLEASMRDVEQQIAEQIEVVSSSRRDVRLIERLREEKLSQWRAGFQKEIGQQADETHLAKLNALGRSGMWRGGVGGRI